MWSFTASPPQASFILEVLEKSCRVVIANAQFQILRLPRVVDQSYLFRENGINKQRKQVNVGYVERFVVERMRLLCKIIKH